MYKYNSRLSDKIWAILPALILGGIMFILVRIVMVYVTLFAIAIEGVKSGLY